MMIQMKKKKSKESSNDEKAGIILLYLSLSLYVFRCLDVVVFRHENEKKIEKKILSSNENSKRRKESNENETNQLF